MTINRAREGRQAGGDVRSRWQPADSSFNDKGQRVLCCTRWLCYEGSIMTKEDWEKIDKALGGLYGFAKLTVDGREIQLQRQRVSKNQLGIVTFVDGKFKGEWGLSSNEHPEQKFLRRVESFVYTEKTRKSWKRLSKRRQKEWGLDPDRKSHYFSPIWPSVTAIRRHYQKTFASIELIEVCG